MPTRVAYSLRNNYLPAFLHPKKIYKTLQKIGKPDFDGFMDAGMPVSIVVTDKTQAVSLLLSGPGFDGLPNFGGVVMCGTTKELKASFQAYLGNKEKIRVFGVDHKEKDIDHLLAYFVRGKTTFSEPQTIICIGPRMKWWGCINQDESQFFPGKWMKYPGVKSALLQINFKELLEGLDECETDPDTDKPVTVISL